jgi:thioredoxin reductase
MTVTGERSLDRCDVFVVGGGPAGLSAALILARARRTVVVCDHGRPRNGPARVAHGYLTRDGTSPGELLRLARGEVLAYGVPIRNLEVLRVNRVEMGFESELRGGDRVRSRVVLLATGVTDRIPEVPGLHELYGTSIHHCPYCDGWEWRDHPIAIYGRGIAGAELSHTLTAWSRDLVLLSDGPLRLDVRKRDELHHRGVVIDERRIARLEGEDGWLRHVVFDDGGRIARDAMFFATGHDQACGIARDLGCRFTSKGSIQTDRHECTSVPGLYAVGDVTRDAHFVIVAAAEGARAAVAIHSELMRDEREREAIRNPENLHPRTS